MATNPVSSYSNSLLQGASDASKNMADAESKMMSSDPTTALQGSMELYKATEALSAASKAMKEVHDAIKEIIQNS